MYKKILIICLLISSFIIGLVLMFSYYAKSGNILLMNKIIRAKFFGAAEGNRTLVKSLEGSCFTIKLQPHITLIES